jgi:hypothetical protein
MKITAEFSLGLDFFQVMDLSPEQLDKFLTLSSRNEIIDWLQWNDPNGIYTDKASISEFGNIVSKDDAIAIMKRQILE